MNSYIAALLSVLILANLTFIIAIKYKRNDFADIVWGMGFLIAMGAALLWTSAELQEEFAIGLRTWIAGACLLAWAVRLSLHIGLRNSKKSEDIRYKKWREEWGSNWKIRSYLQVFLLQALILVVNALPILKIAHHPESSMDTVAWIGVLLWAIGFYFEAVGDHQLIKFKARAGSKGKLMTEGLWSWSRHPNYFGEVVQWWGFFLMAATLPNAWFTIIGPLTITVLILKVSGIPMLEKEMKHRPGFAEYAKRTSVFFPLPPKN